LTLTSDFHPEARAEFFAAIDWYDERQIGLGERFEAAVAAALDSSLLWPEWAPVWPGWQHEPMVRSRPVPGFPSRVVLLISADELTVIAVAHAKRKPGYWRHRA